ncbi:FAD-dependent monooxygenase [Microbacterium sp. RD1]|uniref:FAD-dependent monooxygenase n=1 Tax=Microbacterium sp. RD1 TaxID=3457313 RepID=UPI003FA5A102
MPSPREKHQVVIAGAGPVGMSLALDLGRRGIDVLIVDPAASTTENPRCNTTNARSMEYFRRLGLADRIRRAGLPLDHPTDVVYKTTLDGYELTRFRFSSAQDILDGTAPEFEEWPTPEPQHRISQIFLEPILEDRLRELPTVELRRGWAATGVSQTGASAIVSLRNAQTGEQIAVEADYVAGCDGGTSVIRKAIGARLQGDATAAEERLSVYFRSDEMREILGPDAGWMYWWYGPLHRGSFLQLDGKDLFLLHGRVPVGMAPEDLDPDEVLRAAIGRDIAHEKIQVIRWTPRRLVSDRFVDGRVALAGDAAHLWLPLGGFGMNTGIADAMGLSWRLAALLDGSGGARLLEDYETERQSVGEATSRAALRIDRDMAAIGRDPVLHEPSDAGTQLRSEAGRLIQQIDRKQWWSQGVQFGSRYPDSPGIVLDDEHRAEAIAAIDHYEPSTLAGGRLPHTWLPGHRSLFDELGPEWTLLEAGTVDGDGVFARAAAELGVDLVTLRLSGPEDPVLTGHLVLVRPDMFIAWSADSAPPDASPILAAALGRVAVVSSAEA